MRNLLLGLILAISPFIALSHNPLSAKYYFEVGENASVLNVFLSQDGVNHSLKKQYGEERINSMDQKEFKELIVDYIKDNIDLKVNGGKIVIDKGGIKLGGHETSLKFVVVPIRDKIDKIEVHIAAFEGNDHHQTIFAYNILGKTSKVILGDNNDYKSTINLNAQPFSNNWNWKTIGGLLILILIIFGVKKFSK